MCSEEQDASSSGEVGVKFVYEDSDGVTVMERSEVVDGLMYWKRYDLETEVEDEMDWFECKLDEMSDNELAEWHSDHSNDDMRVESSSD